MTRDRTDHYRPDDLYLDGKPQYVEVAPPRGGSRHVSRLARGMADELNRGPEHWWWADSSSDGSHWSEFRGHHVQVDVEFHTENYRDANSWKGRDEIRAGGIWTLALNRQQCWEGRLYLDPLDALIEIRRIGLALIHHSAIDWSSTVPVAEQLMGRKVYYRSTPGVVSSASVLDQGCVILSPVGVDAFPPAVYELDQDDWGSPDRQETVKTDLLDANIWWWRDKPAGDEPARPAPEPEQTVPGVEASVQDGIKGDSNG